MLGVEMRNTPTQLPNAPDLSVLNIDPDNAAESCRQVVTLDGKVPGLHVSRIDPKVETQRYIDKIIAAKPPNLDAQEQALMQEDLRRASVEPYAWVLNKSVLGAGTHDPLLAARLAGECKQIERMSAGLAKRLFTLPWLTVPPIGCAELSKLVRSPTSSAASDTNHSGIH